MGIPQDPVGFVRFVGAVQLGAGGLLALGKVPRIAAAALAASLLPGTFRAPFWKEEDPTIRTSRQEEFLGNLGLLGGLLFAATDLGGSPSLRWRAKRAARKATSAASDAVHSVGGKTPAIAHYGERAVAAAATLGDLAMQAATKTARAGAERSGRVVDAGTHLAEAGAKRAAHLVDLAGETAAQLGSLVSGQASHAADYISERVG